MRASSVLIAVALASLGCGRIKSALGVETKCKLVHQLAEPPLTDLEPLARIVQPPARPIRAVWSRGQVGGAPEGANLIGEGDWEVVALLEFSEGDANKLTDAGQGEVVEVDLPAAAWISKELNLPAPPRLEPGDCRDLTTKIAGLGYDATPFVQYFLKPVVFLKVPESPFFVLWLSTRPPAGKDRSD